jgi:Uncharacterized protein conserved in bacteria
VKYLVLIHDNSAAWDGLSDAQRREIGRRNIALTDDLVASGELIVSEALAYPSETEHVRNGQRVAGDGPYAEVKEYLAGFYLVDCESIERAIEIATQVAAYGKIEVRPVMDLKGLLEL